MRLEIPDYIIDNLPDGWQATWGVRHEDSATVYTFRCQRDYVTLDSHGQIEVSFATAHVTDLLALHTVLHAVTMLAMELQKQEVDS